MTKRFWIDNNTELIVGEDVPAICKALYRQCEKCGKHHMIANLYPLYTDHPHFNPDKIYGLVIDYAERSFHVVSTTVALDLVLRCA